MIKFVLREQEGVKIVAVCDVYSDRIEAAQESVFEKTGERPVGETDFKKVVDNPEVEAVIIMSPWETHVPFAIYAMNAGKAVGMEVGGAYAVKDCWNLVETYEKTKTPFMFLENCCFGRREMMVLNMVEQGVFGEVVHCSGRYGHDLRYEVTHGVEDRHYRQDNYVKRNCENYPTHDLGPIAKVLKINHGNRILSLTSTASKAAGVKEYLRNEKSHDEALLNTEFKQGDIVTTVLKCAGGETITLMLDTTLPRFYSRSFTVRGTKCMFEEDLDTVFEYNKENLTKEFTWRKEKVGNAADYEEQYDHPVWKEYIGRGVRGSHDGMDWLQFEIFFDCLRNNKPMPVDVYDAATWMAITPLSEESIAKGSAPVTVPDFTKGAWVKE